LSNSIIGKGIGNITDKSMVIHSVNNKSIEFKFKKGPESKAIEPFLKDVLKVYGVAHFSRF